MKTNLSKNLRVYWLTFVVYSGIVLFGFDTGIAGGVVSAPYFQQVFGLLNADGTQNVSRSTSVTANVVSVLQAGAFFGALGSAPISARIGRKLTLAGFTLIFFVGAILTIVPNGRDHHGLSEIYAGRVISGLGIGGISAVAPAFVSECAPKDVRGRITGFFQVSTATGVMVSYFVNFGVNQHIKAGPNIWRIPFGVQLIPAGILALGLFTIKESPRFLASQGHQTAALESLAYLRKESPTSESVLSEMAEIQAALEEERETRRNFGLREAFFGKGNFVRFVIAFVVFFLQQWSGQNSINYYAPQFFSALGFSGSKNSLLASGVYGIIKVVATITFVFFGVETLGRKPSLFISAMGMGITFIIVGATLKTHPPLPIVPNQPNIPSPSAAAKAMASMLYLYVIFYSMGWGPVPWIYVSDIFPTRTRHYGLALASASQWVFNFVISQITPTLKVKLGYKMFLLFGAINIGGGGVFALLVPETKGRSLEEMDIIFGAVSQEKRNAGIAERERELDHESRGGRQTELESDIAGAKVLNLT